MYHSLNVRINGQASTLTTGSAILAFCADPADEIPAGEDAVRWGRSQACQAAGKYWETLKLNIPHNQMHGPNDGFFKNNEGIGSVPRTYSPGFIAYLAISAPSSPTPVEIELTWDVTLRNPTLNFDVANSVDTSAQFDFYIKGNNTADTPYDPALQTVGTSDPAAQRPLEAGDFTPRLQPGIHYRLPNGQFTMVGNTGASGASTTAVCSHITLAGSGNSDVYLSYYDAAARNFQPIELVRFTAQPYLDSVPVFRANSRYEVDPVSQPGNGNQLGFQQSLQSLQSRLRRSIP